MKRLILDLRVGKLLYKAGKEGGSNGRDLTFSQDTQLFELAYHQANQEESVEQALPTNEKEARAHSHASENLTRSNLNS